MFKNKKKYSGVEMLYSVKENKNFLLSMGKPKRVEREEYRIVVIDDEGFNTTVLAKYNYDNVTVHEAFEGIPAYSKFDVILCDIQGIGDNVQSKHGGVEVAIQLKKQYPQKIITLFSGKEKSNIKLNYDILDGFIDKSLSGSELVSKIDEMILDRVNPVLIWDRLEDELRLSQVKNKEIAILEDIYCKSLEDYNNYFDTIEKYNIDTNTVKAISKSISAISLIVKFLIENK